MPTPETLVFDLDGTLIDTAPDLAGTMNVILERHGRSTLDLSTVRSMVGRGARVLMERAMAATGDPVPHELDALTAEFVAVYETRLTKESVPFPGLVPVLDRLQADGHILAVCTNKPERLSRMLLDQLGLVERFAAILGGDSLEVRKPDPLHLTETIVRSGGDVADAVLIGDSTTDLTAARAANVPIVGVSFGYTDIPMADLDPDVLIHDFADLPDALRTVSDGLSSNSVRAS